MPRTRKDTPAVKPLPDLRRRFQLALQDAEISETAWAQQQGYSPQHVRETTIGNRSPAELLRRVHEFVHAREKLMLRRLSRRVKEDAAAVAA